MPDILDPPLSEFRRDLARLRQLLALVRQIREFAALVTPEANADGAFGDAARVLRDSVRATSADIPVISGTLLLYLAGRFEHFVRTSCQSLCDGLASKCQRFDDLPEKLRRNLRALTAEVCASPRKFGFDDVQAAAFITTLAANFVATGGLGSINSACLTITQNNMNPGTLSEVFGRIGVDNLWRDVGAQSTMKAHFATANDQQSQTAAKGKLEDLMEARNQIAHPNGAPSFPDPDQVEEFVAFVEVLGEVLTQIARVHLVAFNA